MINALFGIGFIGSLAAFFIMWAKYDEQKKLTQEERERRWQETSIALTVEKEKDAEIETLRYLLETERRTNKRMLKARCAMEVGYENISKRDVALQDRLSALLCPRNNHVWQDGVCVKCGRVQDG